MINYKKLYNGTYAFISVRYIHIADIAMQSNVEACDKDVNDSHD